MRLPPAGPFFRVFGRLTTGIVAVLLMFGMGLAAHAERPSAMKLFPEE